MNIKLKYGATRESAWDTYCQATEEVFDGFLADVVGQVAQEGGVGWAAGQPGAVHIGLAGRARSGWQDGAVDVRPERILLCVPGGGDCMDRCSKQQSCYRVPAVMYMLGDHNDENKRALLFLTNTGLAIVVLEK